MLDLLRNEKCSHRNWETWVMMCYLLGSNYNYWSWMHVGLWNWSIYLYHVCVLGLWTMFDQLPLFDVIGTWERFCQFIKTFVKCFANSHDGIIY
jgi:hypothetical protein